MQKTKKPLRLIWSGIGKKAYHLRLIEDILYEFKDKLSLHLVISRPSVTDVPDPVIKRLRDGMGAKVSFFNHKTYSKHLRNADVIISPKFLDSAYEMAHSEYKIMLGMAAGLPAVASPQPSYLNVLKWDRGGWICRTPENWWNVLRQLVQDRSLCLRVGKDARVIAATNYSFEKIHDLYQDSFENTWQEMVFKVGWIFAEPRHRFNFKFWPDFFKNEARRLFFQKITGKQDHRHEAYRSSNSYDAVIFVKTFDQKSLDLAAQLKACGTRVVFDINVNYYEQWGEYPVPGTKPTPEQQEGCAMMTTLADLVVARSSYLALQCEKYNSRVVVIPDAVDIDLYRPL